MKYLPTSTRACRVSTCKINKAAEISAAFYYNPIVSTKILISLVILEDAQGRVALQLRGNVATIANSDRWGLFGGHAEAGEEPLQAAVREVQEELTCILDRAKMKFLQSYHRSTDKEYFIYHYFVEGELNEVKLTEGQRFGFFPRDQLELGSIDGKEVVAHHLEAMRKHWEGKPS